MAKENKKNKKQNTTIKKDFGDNGRLKVTMVKRSPFFIVEGRKKSRNSENFNLMEQHKVMDRRRAENIYSNIKRIF